MTRVERGRRGPISGSAAAEVDRIGTCESGLSRWRRHRVTDPVALVAWTRGASGEEGARVPPRRVVRDAGATAGQRLRAPPAVGRATPLRHLGVTAAPGWREPAQFSESSQDERRSGSSCLTAGSSRTDESATASATRAMPSERSSTLPHTCRLVPEPSTSVSAMRLRRGAASSGLHRRRARALARRLDVGRELIRSCMSQRTAGLPDNAASLQRHADVRFRS